MHGSFSAALLPAVRLRAPGIRVFEASWARGGGAL